MADIVVDANVWIVADRQVGGSISKEEENCIKTCRDWLQRFATGVDRLLVDWEYQIISEYRRNLRKGGFAVALLNQLESQSYYRFSRVRIETDGDGHAILPLDISVGDPSDRKYVAVAIHRRPFAPIHVATDRGWVRDKPGLTDYGIIIEELCPDYIQSRIHNT